MSSGNGVLGRHKKSPRGHSLGLLEEVRPRQGGSLGRDPGKEGEPYAGNPIVNDWLFKSTKVN